MGKAKRKPISMPYWYWLGTDNCWWCDNRKACGSCKICKRALYQIGTRQKRREDAKVAFDKNDYI